VTLYVTGLVQTAKPMGMPVSAFSPLFRPTILALARELDGLLDPDLCLWVEKETNEGTIRNEIETGAVSRAIQ